MKRSLLLWVCVLGCSTSLACGSSGSSGSDGGSGRGGTGGTGGVGAAGTGGGGAGTGGGAAGTGGAAGQAGGSGGAGGIGQDGGGQPDAAGGQPAGGATGAAGAVAAPIVVANMGGQGLSLDATSVYFVTQLDGKIWKTSRSNLPSTPVKMGTAATVPNNTAVDDTDLYWTEANGSTVGAVMKCPVAGCPVAGPTPIATGTQAFLIALDSTTVFWANRTSGGSIESKAKAGNGAVTIYKPLNNVLGLAIDADSVYFSAPGTGGFGAQVDKCPLAGCGAAMPTMFAMGAPGPVAVDATSVYWIDGGIQKIAKDGTNKSTVVFPGVGIKPTSLATDGTTLYWSNSFGTIMKCPVNGCGADGPTTIAEQLAQPNSVTIGSDGVYWADGSAIWKAAK